ncbi:MAG TPA: ribosome maturation factor RimP [Bacteroidota bacterium]|nr:ribosome maturation factor RimP [Bacteroidota bacterium]
MSSSAVTDIEKLARPIVEARGAFIVEVRMRGERGGKVFELFVDTEKGVTTELCAEISRELSHSLDLADIIHGRFHLVVSSPGIDRPLKFQRQYPQHIGRFLNVKHTAGGEMQTTEGELLSVSEDGIDLRLKGNSQRTIPFRDIVETHVKAAW